jgi:hypothetical protein
LKLGLMHAKWPLVVVQSLTDPRQRLALADVSSFIIMNMNFFLSSKTQDRSTPL